MNKELATNTTLSYYRIVSKLGCKARVFRDVDVLIVPSLRDEQLTITNFTRSSVAHDERGS